MIVNEETVRSVFPHLAGAASRSPSRPGSAACRRGRQPRPRRPENITGGWTPWLDVPDWFSWQNAGAGVAGADVTGNGRPDIVAFGVDDPPGPQPPPSTVPSGLNQAYYRIGRDIDADGHPTGGWSSLMGVNNWFSWENQGAALAVLDATELVVFAVDHPPGGNAGFYTVLPLVETPQRHGRWELLPFNSQVLAIHAAVLHTGKVLFFAGSGNNTHRDAAPDFGDVTKNIWTS